MMMATPPQQEKPGRADFGIPRVPGIGMRRGRRPLPADSPERRSQMLQVRLKPATLKAFMDKAVELMRSDPVRYDCIEEVLLELMYNSAWLKRPRREGRF